ncbi:hypothetical protein FO519_006917 [Halicephalobus sp. NKZ332]|nr:hypothetical protein FO519_006917 [Halicephalobus sp. NKZ332]
MTNDDDRRPSMVGQPPSKVAVKSPSRRGRKPKVVKHEESESEDVPEEKGTQSVLEEEEEEDSPDEVTTPPPKKRKRGRPADPNSARSLKKKEKEKREKENARRAKQREAKKAKQETEEDTEDNEEPESVPEPEDEDEAETSIKEMPDKDVRKFSSFQLFCDFILRKLVFKDPEEYFTYPVSPSVAPDYAQVIAQPMDFFTMQKKVNEGQYTKLEEVKNDVNLICENAMKYNDFHTVYHLAAQKLQVIAKYYFSDDYLEYIKYTLPFGKEVSREQLGLPEKDLPQRQQTVPTERRSLTAQKIKMDSVSAKRLLADAPADLKKKLTTEVPKWPMGYVDNEDGAVSLNIVTSADKPRLTLGDIVPKPESGHPNLVENFDGAYPVLQPSSYLNYEPFSSFAPMYDTTWAHLSPRDSDLLIQTYGDKENAAGVMQLRQMVMDSGGYFIHVFDDMLNALTDGEHGRTMDALKMTEEEFKKYLEEDSARPTSPNGMRQLLDNIATLKNLGIDTAFTEELKTEYGLTESPTPEETIARNGIMLNDFAQLQSQRFTRTITNLTDVPDPTDTEVELASNLARNFQNQVIQFEIPPQQLVSANTIHNAIGINDDEADYDVLREFMDLS